MNRRLFMSLWAVVAAPFVGANALAPDGPEECLLETSTPRWREIVTTKGIEWSAGRTKHSIQIARFRDEKKAIQFARKTLKLFCEDQSGDAVLVRIHPVVLEA